MGVSDIVRSALRLRLVGSSGRTCRVVGSESMMDSSGSHVIIIGGGGASGVLLAYQLLHQPTRELRITLIERCPEIGRGIAYHTGNPNHLLNVRVASMSALPDEPDHCCRWLASRETDLPLCVLGDHRNPRYPQPMRCARCLTCPHRRRAAGRSASPADRGLTVRTDRMHAGNIDEVDPVLREPDDDTA